MYYRTIDPAREFLMNRHNAVAPQDDEIECRGDWVPAVDVKETSEHLVLFAEVPGLRKQDVKLTVRDKVLSISGEKVQAEQAKDENPHRSERVYGKFCRRFALPTQIDAANISAELVDGVLTVRLPKQEEAKAKEIQIS
jgi:HSP20 family protein